MLGLALEGGGSRGAYHIGVYKACRRQGMEFNAVCGSSIGAVNGALLCQGDAALAEQLWLTLSNKDFFDVDEEKYRKLFTGQAGLSDLAYYRRALRQVREEGGVDTRKMRALIEKLVDPDRLMASPVDFGLVTVSVSDLKPAELFKDQLPPALLRDYIMASATFPGFQPTVIEGKQYVDGGLYDNCPMNMLAERGCRRILAARTFGPGLFRTPRKKDIEVTIISPSEPLGPLMDFDPERAARNIQMGYYDALRQLQGLAGKLYCLRRPPEDWVFSIFCALSEEEIAQACRLAGLETEELSPRRILLERLLPLIAQKLDASTGDYADLLAAMLENRAQRGQIDRFQVYDLAAFLELTARSEAPPPPKTLGLASSNKSRAVEASDFLLQALASRRLG